MADTPPDEGLSALWAALLAPAAGLLALFVRRMQAASDRRDRLEEQKDILLEERAALQKLVADQRVEILLHQSAIQEMPFPTLYSSIDGKALFVSREYEREFLAKPGKTAASVLGQKLETVPLLEDEGDLDLEVVMRQDRPYLRLSYPIFALANVRLGVVSVFVPLEDPQELRVRLASIHEPRSKRRETGPQGDFEEPEAPEPGPGLA